ncbi:hypothetical protein LZ575_17465 [Antarcticibacterium sp. 1MA-6-2]|uniref:hypothetical protein n=1 Tax=Antarcticibacterium sp. 1MA-6-2 TaxID=2908210 RepID=UPI001F486F7D|nr:hypothetical protein [Antarcticibacterium sp. 1MA-6-2]UJH90556.1 hypothetical protein LZ575_17465 [Antarcticibacterium sp. 1MA-6-2]
MILSGYDREILHIVIEDLEDLFSEFGGVEYKGSKLRKSSSTLNMLLIENSLLKAYKIIYGKMSSPVIAAPNLDLYLDADEDRKIVCAVAGGATFLTHEVALIILGGAGNTNFYHAEDYKFNFTSYLNGTSFFSMVIEYPEKLL